MVSISRLLADIIVLDRGRFYHGKTEEAARRSGKRAIAHQRVVDLEEARQKVRGLLENNQPVPPDMLDEYPELVEDINVIKRELRRKRLDRDVRMGVHIDLHELAEFPDILDVYLKKLRDSMVMRLNQSEEVPLDELIMFPDLIEEYGV